MEHIFERLRFSNRHAVIPKGYHKIMGAANPLSAMKEAVTYGECQGRLWTKNRLLLPGDDTSVHLWRALSNNHSHEPCAAQGA